MNNPEREGNILEGNPGSRGKELERLRDILLAPEQGQIADLRERLENPAIHAEHLSRVLPAAIHHATIRDGGDLAEALTPSVETALKSSVQRDPAVLVEAIFPVIGPAIRRAIAEALAGLLQSLNQTLEHTLSPQSFKWRLEAARTGKSFGEVVLSRSLVYRVEQVFLIHKETGLLLQHVHRPEDLASDADMVSGMFTAIQDFARDSFGVGREDTLGTMQVGDLNVWLDSSPHVTLAAVIRGVAPQEFRAVMQNVLEHIHQDQRALLESFEGDAGPFSVIRPRLEDCLRMGVVERPRKRRRPIRWLGLLCALLAAASWNTWSVYHQRRVAADAEREQVKIRAETERSRAAIRAAEEAEERRWTDFVQQLRAEAGIVVTEATGRDGKFYVGGLRDPLAAEPARLREDSGLAPERVVMHWEPYYALSPGMVLRRATQRLQPPPGVTLRLNGDVLVAEGSATAPWLARATRVAESTPGITGFDHRAVRDETMTRLAEKKAAVEEVNILFDEGMTLKPGQESKVEQLARDFAELNAAARINQSRLLITAIGHTSDKGSAVYNAKLAKGRAEAVVALLKAHVPNLPEIIPVNNDTPEPNAGENRRVSFLVTLTLATATMASP